MDRQAATRLIGDTFNFPFDEGRFRNFALNLLNDVDEQKGFDYITGAYIRHSFKKHIAKYRRLGTYTDPNGEKIDVLVVQLKNEWALERSRTMLRNFTSDYLQNRDEKDAALVAYYTTNPDDWRFSYIRMEYKREKAESGKFKITQDITPAKRYSFLVGKNEPNHTAQSQLVAILEDDRNNPTLSALETAFSVDAVTKQFYKDYRAQFEKLWNELNDIVAKDPKIATEFETKTIEPANFAKKLMGQIVFLYFLQKKGWLGVGKDDYGNFKEWGTGPKNFLRRLFDKEFTDYGNFFNDVLEPLFYEALATERPNDIFSRFNCKIPFLNGGLFEPLNDYNWEETDIRIDNDLIGDVFKTFDQYNFTVREDEPLEKEVAVDPEMLGKVFENLLPENLRKGKGAYYTPRTIVHYMCQESLINYLDSNSSILLEKGHKQDACNTLDTIYFDYESLTSRKKRNLPHWEQDGVSYFVTFRLWDAIPKDVAEKIKGEREEWKKINKIENENDLQQLNAEKKKEYYRLFSKRIDDLLDNGHGSCVLQNPEISLIVQNALEHFNGERYLLDHWVIMPNHVHVLMRLINDWSLEKVTHSWKSFTANEINKALKRKGQLWMHESFDHIVRSPEQLFRIRQYIKDNPANLPSSYYRLKCNSTILVEKRHKQDESISTILVENKTTNKQDACDTIPKADIETLIREGDIILELETAIVEEGKKYKSVLMDSIKENAQALDDALANIKVCDPAIGSGAFPVGMLTEIVKARTVLSLYLKSNSSILLESGHKQDACDTYNLKRHCIQNSLYGVDIDPGAIEIAKLRLWLSLVVDEDDYENIQPLPNLDYKIMQGNSLIEEFHGISLDIKKKEGEQFDAFSGGSDLDTLIDDLHQKQENFFNAEHPREKKKKRDAVETAIYNIFHNELEKKKNISPQEAQAIETKLKEMTHGNKERNFFPWKLYFADVFREKGGFDVVIANPPYVNTKDVAKYEWRANLENEFGWVDDLYNHFTHLAVNFSKSDGIVTFITSDTFFTIQTKANMRQLLLENEIVHLISTPKAFSAMVDTAIFIVKKKSNTENYSLEFSDIRKPDFDQLGFSKQYIKAYGSEIATWERILDPLFGSFKSGKHYTKKVEVGLFRENLNQVFFSPIEMNLQIKDKIIPVVKKLYDEYWGLIKTSRDISKNSAKLNEYRKSLQSGDVTLLGMITDGGVGLQTGNNGRLVGCLKGTKSARRILETRSKKLSEAFAEEKSLFEIFPAFLNCTTKNDFDRVLTRMSEIEIRELFDEIKLKTDRDIFGQGYLFRIIDPSEIAEIDAMTNDEKQNGINNNRKDHFVLYDKGDKDGNRWFAESPYYIDWSINSVKWLKGNSGKKGKGMPVVRNPKFYFRAGFCWTDVNSTYLKSRVKFNSVHDVLSMSLFSMLDLVSEKYIVCMINSKFMSEFVEDFVNNTSHFQINDARRAPIIIPTNSQRTDFENLFDRAYSIKEQQFSKEISQEIAELKLNEIQDELDEMVYGLHGLRNDIHR